MVQATWPATGPAPLFGVFNGASGHERTISPLSGWLAEKSGPDSGRALSVQLGSIASLRY